MPDTQPTDIKNLDIYGHDPLEWSRALADLDGAPERDIAAFLGTVRPDGRPHSAGIGPAWLGGSVYFTSSPAARKAKDLAANPACTLSLRLPTLDLVLEGDAVRVTDPATLESLAGALPRGRLAGGGRRRRADGAVQRPERRPAAVARLPARVPHGVRRRDG